MAVTFVQSDAASLATTTSHSVTYDAAPTQNNLLVAIFRPNTIDVSVTGPTGWTKAIALDRGTNFMIGIWFKVAEAGESSTVTFTTLTSVVSDLLIMEFSGNQTASPLDKTNSADGGGPDRSSWQPGSTGVLAQADEVIISGVGQGGNNGGSEAIDSGFTILHAAILLRSVGGYKIVAATTAENPTHSWTTVQQAAGVIATFKAAGAAVSDRRQQIRSLNQAVNRSAVI